MKARTTNSSFNDLNQDTLLIIASFLDPQALFTFMQLNKKTHQTGLNILSYAAVVEGKKIFAGTTHADISKKLMAMQEKKNIKATQYKKAKRQAELIGAIPFPSLIESDVFIWLSIAVPLWGFSSVLAINKLILYLFDVEKLYPTQQFDDLLVKTTAGAVTSTMAIFGIFCRDLLRNQFDNCKKTLHQDLLLESIESAEFKAKFKLDHTGAFYRK